MATTVVNVGPINGANGTSGSSPLPGTKGTAATYNLNGMVNADSYNITATGGNGGNGGNNTGPANGNGGKGGDGAASTIGVNGTIFKPLGPNFDLIGTAIGGNGGLGGTGFGTGLAGANGNGGDATIAFNGNIINASTALGHILLDAVAESGTGVKYGNASATLNGNIVNANNVAGTDVQLLATALANGPDNTANNGNTAFGTKTATVNGNILNGYINNASIFADAYLSNATATINGNILNSKSNGSGIVALEATGQKININGNILNLGKQELDLTLNELGPTYNAVVSGNIFNGTGSNKLVLTNGFNPGPAPGTDTAVVNLATGTFTLNGNSNIINKFGSIALNGNIQGNFIGTSGNNVLDASGDTTTGTIIFQGNGGTDTIKGGPNALNVTYFAGAEWQYATANLTSVIGGPAGNTSNDTLSGIQRLKFLSPSHVSDINNDGYGDLIFQNTITSSVEFQLQPGGPDVTLTPPGITGTWSAIGTGQFTADTDRKAGLLLQDTSTGNLEVLTGIDPVTGAYTATALSTQPGSTNWKAITAGDFNGDAASDVLLQNSATGAVEIMFLDTKFGEPVGQVDAVSAVTTPGANWNAISSGDFNGDGNSDILWQNSTTGAVDISLMTGATGSPTAIGSATGFAVVGSGDFNGDGKSDILLRNNTTGDAQIWLMNGTSQIGAPINVAGPGAGWTLMGAEDVNKDGFSDLLWQNTLTGQVDAQEMTTGATPLGGLINLGTPLAGAFKLVASTGGG